MFVPHKKRLRHRARGLRGTEGGVFSSSSPTPVPTSKVQSPDWRKVHAPMPLQRHASAGESVGECGMWGGMGVLSGTTLDTKPAFSLRQRGRRRPSGDAPSTTLQIFSLPSPTHNSARPRSEAPPRPSQSNDGPHNAKMSEEKAPRPLPFGYTFAAGESLPSSAVQNSAIVWRTADRGCPPHRCHCRSLRGTWPFPMRLANSLTMRHV